MSWTITPQTKVPVDPVFNNVSLLLHGNGANGSTTITDSSPTPKTVTAVGNAQISTAQSKFGGSSIAFDGTGDYLSVPDSADTKLATGDFTIEGWFYFNSTSGTVALAEKRANASAYAGILFWLVNGVVNVYASSNGSAWNVLANSFGTLASNQWHHIALVRSGSSFFGYTNGVQSTLATSSSVILYDTSETRIGQSASGSTNNLNGYIDDLRITKGVARYTANFTPPTAPFPDI